MKRLILVPVLFICTIIQAQDKLESDGFNLESVCQKPCNYIAFPETVFFPFDYDKEWQIDNLEFGLKPTGDFIITGDLNIVGKDTAAILELEFLFFDADAKTIHTEKVEKFEFFNDPGVAEPICFTGKLPENVAAQTKFADVGIVTSERVPYYTISSNCFHPCKSNILKDALKVFKKIK